MATSYWPTAGKSCWPTRTYARLTWVDNPPEHYQPIGIFDSGIGGLSVLRDIRARLPHEHLIYVADSGYAPYGHQSGAFIEQRSLAVAGFLVKRPVKALVVACNTATAEAIARLRQELTIPVIGMEPGLKPAAMVSKSRVIGVLATVGTLNSERFSALLARSTAGVEVLVQPCPGLVEQIEAGEFDTPTTRQLVENYLTPLLRRGVDTLVLGCTHYPWVLPVISDLAGPAVRIVDTGPAVASQLQRRLAEVGLLNQDVGLPGTEEFWTSGSVEHLRRLISRLWGRADGDDPQGLQQDCAPEGMLRRCG
ncbi:MAG: glutamate racemase [Gammaproteobacteria bacterium]|nr:glutamate racemase [Gammaproteobacteria bacterium]